MVEKKEKKTEKGGRFLGEPQTPQQSIEALTASSTLTFFPDLSSPARLRLHFYPNFKVRLHLF